MKKAVLFLLVIILLATAGVYLIFPAKITIGHTALIDVSEANISRFLTRKENWKMWWPSKNHIVNNTLFTFDGADYRLIEGKNSGMDLLINKGAVELKSNVTFLAEGNLKTKVTWVAESGAENNPFKRIARYLAVRQIEHGTVGILKHLKAFLENEQNVYGYNIHLGKVRDSLMLATSAMFTEYPGTHDVYVMIEKLHKEIKRQSALETNYPMLNIHRLSKDQFEAMVAIPINELLKPAQNFFINKMVLGNILIADVKGGQNTVDHAMQQVTNFAKDYKLTSPAMPFESLVTDRSHVIDTSRWITKIYYPIF